MNLNEALQNYVNAIADNYDQYTDRSPYQNTADERKAEFRENIKVTQGKKYAKVITGNSVHSFVVLADNDKQFNQGDILKAAGWAAPARNKARGNVLGEYNTNWTGAPYL